MENKQTLSLNFEKGGDTAFEDLTSAIQTLVKSELPDGILIDAVIELNIYAEERKNVQLTIEDNYYSFQEK